ncbi:MAG: hypothetical protein HWD58_01770 [Bacteroidota bacterium]|nr:MAG: hypothetical protein HWD58_01770 [Bacteroidota bacterium]
MPKHLPTDEVYIKTFVPKKTERKESDNESVKGWKFWIVCIAGVFLLLILVIVALPSIIYIFYKNRARNSRSVSRKIYFTYRCAGLLLNQLGMYRGESTYLKFAKRVDSRYDSRFTPFIINYLKLKYSGQELTAQETSDCLKFLQPFIQQVSNKHPLQFRIKRFLNPIPLILFYFGSEPDDTTT